MQFFWIKLLRQYRNTPKCVSSKAALLTLLWVFVIYLIYIFSYQPANYISNFTHSPIDILVAIYAVNAVVLCLFPVAGFLADNKFGRYRTVTKSLYLLIVSLLLALPLLLPLPILDHLNDSLKVPIAITLLAVASVPILLLTVSFIGLVAMSFSLEWTSFMTHQPHIKAYFFIGSCGFTTWHSLPVRYYGILFLIT